VSSAEIPIALISTATRWLGTARMPRSLAQAGFAVALLAPEGSLALHAHHFRDVQQVSAQATPMQWLEALVALVDRAAPQLLVPCDEMANRLLFSLVLEQPAGIALDVHTRLVRLITNSLGDPTHYLTTIDKTRLPDAAAALGVRVPAHAIARSEGEALAFAAANGYPVVVKRRFGFAGQGVVVASTPREVAQAFATLGAPDQLDLGEDRARELLVQRFMRGSHQSQAVVASNGECLCAFAWERYRATAKDKGQTTVLRFVDSPRARESTIRLMRGFGISGFVSAQFIVTDDGEAWLLEINRRIVTHLHTGERVGADLARVLYRKLTGATDSPNARRPPSPFVTVFPREWLRDPESADLRAYPVDVPWDEPELFAAMLAMRRET
jgi:predicted ATP-grasp superfamily ATP-dependent carboligase